MTKPVTFATWNVNSIRARLPHLLQYLQAANAPEAYTYTQAAAKLGVCRQTVSRMVSAGTIKLNGAGKIPAAELKRASAAQGD